jgi:hypothetical protein
MVFMKSKYTMTAYADNLGGITMLNKTTIKRNIAVARDRMTTMPNRDGKNVDIAMLLPLAEMAALDICPDGTFSDAECLAWEAMREAIRLAND